mmetsp:Transcript_11030/g.21858  ORF Transcript_11030/g.21858 Transcript_11030/m.21858 type:complete len:483 (+) Transcript_11030:76-1524(+)
MSSNEPLPSSAPAQVLGGVELVPALPPVPAVGDVSAVAAVAPPPAVQEIQGISTSKLLEPIQREAPKLGRKNGVSNLTASQKLDILHELDSASAAAAANGGGDVAAATTDDAAAAGEKSTVTKLAAQYNISRQSIYRWKKEMPRLMEQAKEQQLQQQDGSDGMTAALASATRKRGHGETMTLLAESDAMGGGGGGAVDPNVAILVKKPTGEEYTAQQKLAMVRQLKSNSKDGNKLRVREFASKHGVNYRTLYRWIKSEERLVELVEGEGMGSFKRTKFDGHLDRIKEALKVFVAHYTKDDDAADGEEGKAKKITGRIIAEKAKHIKEEMLAQHEVEPFLSGEEVKAMREFTGSQSWGRKMCRRYGWGNSSETGNKKKGDDDDVSDDDDDVELNDGGEPVDMTETDDPAKMKLQIKKLKSEVHFLKIKSGKFEKKAAKSETENKSLRKQIEVLKSKDATPSLPLPSVPDAAAYEAEPTVEVNV